MESLGRIVVQPINSLYILISLNAPFSTNTEEVIIRGEILDLAHAAQKMGPRGANLVAKLIKIPGIECISVAYHRLTIQREARATWEELKDPIKKALATNFNSEIQYLRVTSFEAWE